MQYYSDPFTYIESCKTLKARIAACDAIIDALIIAAGKAAAGENITQYTLNDGQTIISTTKRSSSDISASIIGIERIRNLYVNKSTGRVFRLVDGKNLTGNGYNR